MVTYYKEFNGNEDSITDYLDATFKQARQARKNCEQLCNELVKRKVYRNYRIVIEKVKYIYYTNPLKGGDAID